MLVDRLPLAELHLHIEGTLEPELMFALAERNHIQLPFDSIEAARRAYEFTDLQSFLDIYYAGMEVLRTEADFRDLTNAYLRRARGQGVVHAEIFFDPQAHVARGVGFDTVIDGLCAAIERSVEDFGITTKLIMCFLRDRPVASAMHMLDLARPHGHRIVAVGLDSAERGNPPSTFEPVFERALAEGYLTVAHAGEEGPAEYVWQALDLLKVSRIDHGVRSTDDQALVARLRASQIPLTMCPLSNLKLNVCPALREHPLKTLLDAGVLVTVNSDDPAYFGGYVADNLRAVARELALTDREVQTLAENSFRASFLSEPEKRIHLAAVRAVVV